MYGNDLEYGKQIVQQHRKKVLDIFCFFYKEDTQQERFDKNRGIKILQEAVKNNDQEYCFKLVASFFQLREQHNKALTIIERIEAHEKKRSSTD